MKLTIELVPKTAWYTNVRSNVTDAQWDVIRKKSYAAAGNVCEVCGDNGRNQGTKHPVECHEVWHYDDQKRIQKLVGLVALCPYCHKVKHPGLANIKGEGHIVLAQLMKVNGMSRSEAEEAISDAFAVWEERSRYQWELDISYVQEYLKQ